MSELVVIAYVPALHEGYRQFFRKCVETGCRTLFVLGNDAIQKFIPDLHRKDIRRLDPSLIVKALLSWGDFKKIEVADTTLIENLFSSEISIVMPDEDISREIIKLFPQKKGVQLENVFLRWDKQKTIAKSVINPDDEVTIDEFHQRIMSVAQIESLKSSDWWRQVGACLIKDGEILIVAHNEHWPFLSPYTFGDPRGNFKKGLAIELSTAEHAEAAIVGIAVNSGISLAGTDLYVTTFPCPPCANLIGRTGIETLYYTEGYSMLGGVESLRSRNIKVVRVEKK